MVRQGFPEEVRLKLALKDMVGFGMAETLSARSLGRHNN